MTTPLRIPSGRVEFYMLPIEQSTINLPHRVDVKIKRIKSYVISASALAW